MKQSFKDHLNILRGHTKQGCEDIQDDNLMFIWIGLVKKVKVKGSEGSLSAGSETAGSWRTVRGAAKGDEQPGVQMHIYVRVYIYETQHQQQLNVLVFIHTQSR